MVMPQMKSCLPCKEPGYIISRIQSLVNLSHTMKKVVVNNSYSPFRFSSLALAMLHAMNFPMDEFDINEHDTIAYRKDEFTPAGLYGYTALEDVAVVMYKGVCYTPYPKGYSRDQLRSHPVMVKVVELLGPAASAKRSNLELVEVPDDVPYRISDYDNAEGVVLLNMDDFTLGYEARDIDVPEDVAELAEKVKKIAVEKGPKR